MFDEVICEMTAEVMVHYTYMYLYIFRPDMRGSGDSTGFYYDEYDYQEQKDACELIGNVCHVIYLQIPNIYSMRINSISS